MKYQKYKFILILGPIITLILFLLFITSCEPSIPITVYNQTSQTLTIFVNNSHKGNVEPGTQVKIGISGVLSKQLIEAKNAQGEIVYSKNIATADLLEASRQLVIQP